VKHSSGVPLSLGLCVRDSSEALFGCLCVRDSSEVLFGCPLSLGSNLKIEEHPKSASLEFLTHKPKDRGTPEECFTRVSYTQT
jgi:hypothetical protein